jgi:hypothetical protein
MCIVRCIIKALTQLVLNGKADTEPPPDNLTVRGRFCIGAARSSASNAVSGAWPRAGHWSCRLSGACTTHRRLVAFFLEQAQKVRSEAGGR